jgi:transcriptional regulator with XRE-family HTH domain
MARETQARTAKGKPNVPGRVREARALLGLSQVALAKALGQAERTVQARERDERTPRIGSLVRLAERVDRPVAWFYGDGDEPVEKAA